jgi:hypothetical protein
LEPGKGGRICQPLLLWLLQLLPGCWRNKGSCSGDGAPHLLLAVLPACLACVLWTSSLLLLTLVVLRLLLLQVRQPCLGLLLLDTT